MLQRLEQSQQNTHGASGSPEISEGKCARIAATLAHLEVAGTLDEYRKGKLLDKLGSLSPSQSRGSQLYFDARRSTTKPHHRSLASSPSSKTFTRGSRHSLSKSVACAPSEPDPGARRALDLPATPWQPPDSGFSAIPARFYDRYEDMFALKQGDFHATGFKPGALDPQKDTKTLLNALGGASMSQHHAEPSDEPPTADVS